MTRSSLGSKALVLCAIVVGLLAFAMAGAAQAEPGASWGYINPISGKLELFTKLLEPSTQISELENKTGSLLFTTKGGTKVTILCTGVTIDEGGQLGPEGRILLFRLHFTGCVTFLNGTLSKACEPRTGASKGLILSAKAEGLIVLHKLLSGEIDPMILIIPDEKETLATIELGETCAIGESVAVTNHLDLWDCNKEFTVHKVSHLLEEFPELHLMKALGQPALIDGSILVKLTGTHEGYKWAGLPA
jgi:hypothetical protein